MNSCNGLSKAGAEVELALLITLLVGFTYGTFRLRLQFFAIGKASDTKRID